MDRETDGWMDRQTKGGRADGRTEKACDRAMRESATEKKGKRKEKRERKGKKIKKKKKLAVTIDK